MELTKISNFISGVSETIARRALTRAAYDTTWLHNADKNSISIYLY